MKSSHQFQTDKNKLMIRRNEMENLCNFAGQLMFNSGNVLGKDRYVPTAYFVDTGKNVRICWS